MVAIYLDFYTGMTLDECRDEYSLFQTVFKANETLWAILFFTENQFVGNKQYYDYLCICVDASYEGLMNWPFPTMILNN
jgi:hypothetical protein